MKEITCHLRTSSYSVYIGRNVLAQLPTILRKHRIYGKALVVTNRRIHKLCFGRVRQYLEKTKLTVHAHLVPDSEEAKSRSQLFRMYDTLIKHTFDRHATIIALGGGVVGDISGFCAATYMRGISFINIPTTLLAQVDSAIGGKTAINLTKGKNLVGAFYQPRCVISDVSLLGSLSRSQRADSLAEVIKYGVIADKTLFNFLEQSIEKALAGNVSVLERIIHTATAIKVRVVERDEKETTGLRAILNFGHTFGHAFEAASKYRGLAHGQAVALGMIAASRVASRRGMFTEKGSRRIEALVKRIGLWHSLRHFHITPARVWHFMQYDKKNKNNKVTLVLPTKIGHVAVYRNVAQSHIMEAIESLCF